MEKQLKITISNVENENQKELSNGLKEILKEQQDKGNIEFEAILSRKCDFCGKKLEMELDDSVEQIQQENGDILDKCEECQKNG